MELTLLGTGNALVTACYNTCFVLHEENRYMMVDAGGGNTVLRQLMQAGISVCDIHDLFVTHRHVDHILGVVWMIRVICQNMKKGAYTGEARIYGHDEVIDTLRQLCAMLLDKKQTKYIGTRLHFIPVTDGETREIQGKRMTFFDIHSDKAKQYGFRMELENGNSLVCCGDEPYRDCERAYAEGCTWLLHEAFCLHTQAEQFRPYEKQHSTVRDACRTAERLGVQNLVLYHTEDENIENRRALYTAEGQPYFSGRLYIPEDLETISL